MDSGSSRAEVIAFAESSTNAAMAAAVLPRFAELIELSAKVTGDTQYLSLAKEIRDFAASQAVALKKHAWNGAWLNRAWIPLPKNGSNPGAQQFPGGWACTNGVDDRLCLEPQPWAILASSTRINSSVGEGPTAVLTRPQITTLVESLQTKLKSPLGATVLSTPFARAAVQPDIAGPSSFRSTSGNAADAGEHENGGVWPSQNHPLVLALATVNATAALDEWVRNSRSTQAQLFPQFWPGVWSAADVVTSHLSTDGQAGTQAWPAMPVLCTHPHSWPVYSAARLAGLSFDKGGLRLAPALPVAAGGYSLQTSLASVERIHHPNGDIEYTGRYTPLRTTTCDATVSLRAAHPEVLIAPTIAKVQVGIDDGTQSSGEVPSQLQAVDSEGELRFPRQVCGPGAALVFRVHIHFSSGNFEDV